MALVKYDDGSEVLICELTHEDTLIKEYFIDGGRNVEEYDRELCEGTIEVNSKIIATADRTIT